MYQITVSVQVSLKQEQNMKNTYFEQKQHYMWP